MAATFTARPTIYNGIQMRSRLEAGFAAWLDKVSIRWTYEPAAFGHPELGQYLPDFRLHDIPVTRPVAGRSEVDVYIEVKPRSFLGGDDANNLAPFDELDRLAKIIHHNRPDSLVALIEPPAASDRYAELGVLEWDPIGVKQYWPTIALWTNFPDGRVGICWPLTTYMGPWPDGWWKGATT